MRGKPKYKIGDKVKFLYDGKERVGEVYIVDKYGTFQNPSDVSYDVMIHDWVHPNYPDQEPGDCLVKHLTESTVFGLEDEIPTLK